MSLVNEAAVDAARAALEPYLLREEVRKALEAAAPHIGGEAIRQAVAAERLEDPTDDTDKAYERALDDVLAHAEVER